MAEVRFVLCALWELGPRSPSTGDRYDRAALSATLGGGATASDALELGIARRARARGEMANRFILLGEDATGAAREIFSERPMFVPEMTWQKVLESHALDLELADALRDNDYDKFVLSRGPRMRDVTQNFLERMTETTFEDTPPLDELDLDDIEEESDLAET